MSNINVFLDHICIYMSSVYVCIYSYICVYIRIYICINMQPSASRFHIRIFVDYICKFMQLGAAWLHICRLYMSRSCWITYIYIYTHTNYICIYTSGPLLIAVWLQCIYIYILYTRITYVYIQVGLYLLLLDYICIYFLLRNCICINMWTFLLPGEQLGIKALLRRYWGSHTTYVYSWYTSGRAARYQGAIQALYRLSYYICI